MPVKSLEQDAKTALSCLDLTSLNSKDTESDIAALCSRAQSPWGSVAAVCVFPRWAAFARKILPPDVAVAAVSNFPAGDTDARSNLSEVETIVQSGAQEVDFVLPYRKLIEGDVRYVTNMLDQVRAACTGLKLKVILESGELVDPTLIARAAQLSLDAGADFLKTSTGKTPVSATPLAARVMLETVRRDHRYADRVGFKASGGIRTVSDAIVYMELVKEIWGQQALTPLRFRLGASSLLDSIEACLAGGESAQARSSGNY